MTPEDMRQHVAAICRDENIRVLPHSRGGRASRTHRIIAIRPVKSAITYAVALHELGHVLGPWQSQPRLYAEAGAWKWAREVAGIWTPTMDVKMSRSLHSYVLWAERRAPRVKLPEDDHEFWILLGTPPEPRKRAPAKRRRRIGVLRMIFGR
ncbi:hypothetical protein [Emcibacter sp. SYSU 3D8]|uniref:hypothetical protein n=1 Tax=Emcibacter sp. SYSU 3D8 TaxID=3133969 RepID=UPI0031FEC8D5